MDKVSPIVVVPETKRKTNEMRISVNTRQQNKAIKMIRLFTWMALKYFPNFLSRLEPMLSWVKTFSKIKRNLYFYDSCRALQIHTSKFWYKQYSSNFPKQTRSKWYRAFDFIFLKTINFQSALRRDVVFVTL